MLLCPLHKLHSWHSGSALHPICVHNSNHGTASTCVLCFTSTSYEPSVGHADPVCVCTTHGGSALDTKPYLLGDGTSLTLFYHHPYDYAYC